MAVSYPNFPPLIFVEKEMSSDEIIKRLDTAFGKLHTVVNLTDCGEYKRIEIRKYNSFVSQRMTEWEKFYESLDKHGSVWLDSGEMYVNNHPGLTHDDYINRSFLVRHNFKVNIKFSAVPIEGYWEVKYADNNHR